MYIDQHKHIIKNHLSNILHWCSMSIDRQTEILFLNTSFNKKKKVICVHHNHGDNSYVSVIEL